MEKSLDDCTIRYPIIVAPHCSRGRLCEQPPEAAGQGRGGEGRVEQRSAAQHSAEQSSAEQRRAEQSSASTLASHMYSMYVELLPVASRSYTYCCRRLRLRLRAPRTSQQTRTVYIHRYSTIDYKDYVLHRVDSSHWCCASSKGGEPMRSSAGRPSFRRIRGEPSRHGAYALQPSSSSWPTPLFLPLSSPPCIITP